MADVRWIVECPTCHAKVKQPCRKPEAITHVYEYWQHPKREALAAARGRDPEVVAALRGEAT